MDKAKIKFIEKVKEIQEKIEILFWIVEKIGKAVKVTLIREIVF